MKQGEQERTELLSSGFPDMKFSESHTGVL